MAIKGNFSNGGRHTFDPKKHYVSIKLQQGVPLLDRDWNEMEDIRRYFERMLKKWYIGNGVPKDSDGFKMIAPPDERENDFLIQTGHCLVNGYDVENEKDIYYSLQVESNDQLLRTPKTNRRDLVYLEVWTETIDSSDDPSLRNSQDINMETCVRERLIWKVRVRPWITLELPPIFLPPLLIDRIFHFSSPRTILRRYAPLISARSADLALGHTAMAAPLPAEINLSWLDVDNNSIPPVGEIEEMTAPDVEAYEKDGHSIYPLAFIERKANNPKITKDMILDLRQTNINLSHLTRRVENLESEIFFWDVMVTPKDTLAFYGSPVEIEVEVRDAHGPRKGALVEFSTDFGFFNALSATTDEFGKAKTTLVGSAIHEVPADLPTLNKEIIEFAEIHKVLKSAYSAANPNIEKFVAEVKFSSSQMNLIEKHTPDYILRDPVVDRAILTRPVKEIASKTATINVHVKYSSERPILKGLGSIQITFRQWMRPWLTHFVDKAFESIKAGYTEAVNANLAANWNSATNKLDEEAFRLKLVAEMDGIREKVNTYFMKNMVVSEESPFLGRFGEILHDSTTDKMTQVTKNVISEKIQDMTHASSVINTALTTTTQLVSLHRIKNRIEFRAPLRMARIG